MADKKGNPTRYQQVQQILTTADNNSTADYQGYGKFWLLPLQAFQEVVIYGIRMIEPLPPESNCGTFVHTPGSPPSTEKTSCGCCKTADPVAPPSTPPPSGVKYPGRGEKSGLIKALRAERPFNDTQFPPFMWGGKPVSPPDIQFISDWIDDGCPETDQVTAATNATTAANLSGSLSARLGQTQIPVATRSVSTIKREAGQPHQRKNAECLSEEELCNLREAMAFSQHLSAQYPNDNRGFETYARLHGDECPHGWEAFLPWHRMMLYEFEKQLQEFVPDVTLPYWDWPMDIYNKGMQPAPADVKLPKGVKGPIAPQYLSGIIPTPYRCFLNQAAAERLVARGVPSGIMGIVGFSYNAGVEFLWVVAQLIGKDAARAYKDLIYNELKTVNPLWHNFRYPGMFFDSKTGKPQGGAGITAQFHHHFPKQSDIDQILQLNNWLDFGGGPNIDDSFGVVDQEPHNTVHLWAGGENPDNYNGKDPDVNNPPIGSMLGNLTAAFDPIFYAHHANVDRIFTQWQSLWRGQTAYDPNDVLAGLNYTIGDAWDVQRLGYEYVMDSKYFETTDDAGFQAIRTEKSNIHAKALDGHTKAVLKLHDILPTKRSMTLRVFVNQPDANENTPVIDNSHYAGHITIFGHGDCIGGPGHCDMPKPQSRFDIRTTRHNRPTNHRMDITEAVKRMKDKGHDNIEIKVVAVNAGHGSVDDMLRLKGLSVNFH